MDYMWLISNILCSVVRQMMKVLNVKLLGKQRCSQWNRWWRSVRLCHMAASEQWMTHVACKTWLNMAGTINKLNQIESLFTSGDSYSLLLTGFRSTCRLGDPLLKAFEEMPLGIRIGYSSVHGPGWPCKVISRIIARVQWCLSASRTHLLNSAWHCYKVTYDLVV